MRKNNFKNEQHCDPELEIIKSMMESLCAKNYSDVCVNLARLIEYFTDKTEATVGDLVGGVSHSDNRVSLERACGLMGGMSGRFISTPVHTDRVRLLRDMVVVSGFAFEKIYSRLHDLHGHTIPFEKIEFEIRDVIKTITNTVTNNN
ncbi:hypothetical protein [Photobacterium damselae]|uniref:hypothetical protein n=1 Tax=Photobacterium damselae TaxID=38293 RepID=UPI004067B8B9